MGASTDHLERARAGRAGWRGGAAASRTAEGIASAALGGAVGLSLAAGAVTVAALGTETIADQQRVADAFSRINLIPKPLRVSDIVWLPPQGNATAPKK